MPTWCSWNRALCQLNIPVTPSGIEPATFWLVAQFLNQLRHCGTDSKVAEIEICVFSVWQIRNNNRYPEDNLSLLQHGESLKTRTDIVFPHFLICEHMERK
jgi:hypothetical protein